MGSIMKKNTEKDFDFFVKREIIGIILSVTAMLAAEAAIVCYYLVIAREENFYDAFGSHAPAMIILPVLPLYFMLYSMLLLSSDPDSAFSDRTSDPQQPLPADRSAHSFPVRHGP